MRSSRGWFPLDMARWTGSNNIIRPSSLSFCPLPLFDFIFRQAFSCSCTKEQLTAQINPVCHLRRKGSHFLIGQSESWGDPFVHRSILGPHTLHWAKHRSCGDGVRCPGLGSLTIFEEVDAWERRLHPTQTTSPDVNRCKTTWSGVICLASSPAFHSTSCRDSALSLGVCSH